MGPDGLLRWGTRPIGGEVRPEVWDCLWDEPSCAPAGREFLPCVETTHVSWLMNTGGVHPEAHRNPAGPRHRRRPTTGIRMVGAARPVLGRSRPVLRVLHDHQHRRGAILLPLAGGSRTRPRRRAGDVVADRLGRPAPRARRGQSELSFSTDASRIGWTGPRAAARGESAPKRTSPRFANQTQDEDLPGWLTLGTLAP